MGVNINAKDAEGADGLILVKINSYYSWRKQMMFGTQKNFLKSEAETIRLKLNTGEKTIALKASLNDLAKSNWHSATIERSSTISFCFPFLPSPDSHPTVAPPLFRLIKPIHCTDLVETVHRFCQTALGLKELSELAQNNITRWSAEERGVQLEQDLPPSAVVSCYVGSASATSTG